MTQLSIIFLGTGGSWPTVKRNVSSVAIKRGSEVILFDCGEGTQRQFQKSKLSYMQTSKIFVTHFHGDHFLGLPGLFQTMQLNDRDTPLHIYGPKGIGNLVSELISLGYFRPHYKIIAHEINGGDVLDFNGYKIRAMNVEHNVPALAYALEENMRQIVISGDTIPLESMIDFAKNADVLVHEATFDSELEDVSQEYGHTTAFQAAEIAKKAKVGQLFLTHISPRYLDHHVLEDDARKVFKKSIVPKDFQEVEVKLKK